MSCTSLSFLKNVISFRNRRDPERDDSQASIPEYYKSDITLKPEKFTFYSTYTYNKSNTQKGLVKKRDCEHLQYKKLSLATNIFKLNLSFYILYPEKSIPFNMGSVS